MDVSMRALVRTATQTADSLRRVTWAQVGTSDPAARRLDDVDSCRGPGPAATAA
jgi:hypothetical protein